MENYDSVTVVHLKPPRRKFDIISLGRIINFIGGDILIYFW